MTTRIISKNITIKKTYRVQYAQVQKKYRDTKNVNCQLNTKLILLIKFFSIFDENCSSYNYESIMRDLFETPPLSSYR